jgi:hypothetical protein
MANSRTLDNLNEAKRLLALCETVFNLIPITKLPKGKLNDTASLAKAINVFLNTPSPPHKFQWETEGEYRKRIYAEAMAKLKSKDEKLRLDGEKQLAAIKSKQQP